LKGGVLYGHLGAFKKSLPSGILKNKRKERK